MSCEQLCCGLTARPGLPSFERLRLAIEPGYLDDRIKPGTLFGSPSCRKSRSFPCSLSEEATG